MITIKNDLSDELKDKVMRHSYEVIPKLLECKDLSINDVAKILFISPNSVKHRVLEGQSLSQIINEVTSSEFDQVLDSEATLKQTEQEQAQIQNDHSAKKFHDDMSKAQDEANQAYIESAREELGEELLGLFLRRTDLYAEYVNEHEPELLKYINMPCGKILLNEWFRRMNIKNYDRNG